MIQSQMVTPPLAAMDGTTLRLKTATTKRSTRSRRPRARMSFGAASGWAVVDKIFRERRKQVPHSGFRRDEESQRFFLPLSSDDANGADECVRPYTNLVRDRDRFGALLLRFRQASSDIVEGGEVLVDVGVGMLHRDRPLLIPPRSKSTRLNSSHRR